MVNPRRAYAFSLDADLQHTLFVSLGGRAGARRPPAGTFTLHGLIEKAECGDVVAVARLEDCGGSLSEFVACVRRALQKGVALVVEDVAIDTRAPDTLTLLKAFEVAALFEQRFLVAGWTDQIEAARRGGAYRAGRPAKLDLDEAAHLHAAGLGATAIARQLGVSRWTVHRALRSRSGSQEDQTGRTRPRSFKSAPSRVNRSVIAQLRAEGLGATAIARQLGIARWSVYRALRSLQTED